MAGRAGPRLLRSLVPLPAPRSVWTDIPDAGRVHARAWDGTAEGGGVPVVLLHGLGLSSRHLVPLGARLARLGHRVLVPDLPGFGRSPVRPAAGGPPALTCAARPRTCWPGSTHAASAARSPSATPSASRWPWSWPCGLRNGYSGWSCPARRPTPRTGGRGSRPTGGAQHGLRGALATAAVPDRVPVDRHRADGAATGVHRGRPDRGPAAPTSASHAAPDARAPGGLRGVRGRRRAAHRPPGWRPAQDPAAGPPRPRGLGRAAAARRRPDRAARGADGAAVGRAAHGVAEVARAAGTRPPAGPARLVPVTV
ncbi:alpha/beta fold hydrolase [Geodermatophilus sp. SYSU D00697]